MEPKRTTAAKRPAGNAERADQPRGDRSAMRHYLLLHGDVLEMYSGTERPNLDVKPGERRKRVLYSSTDLEAVEAKMRELAPTARGLVGKGEAY